MSLRSVIQAATENAFNAIGDIKEPITYNQKSAGEYDVDTGVNIHTSTIHTLEAVVVASGEYDETTKRAYNNRLKILINNDIDFEPDTNDEIIYKGLRFNVVNINTDPVNAHYVIEVFLA